MKATNEQETTDPEELEDSEEIEELETLDGLAEDPEPEAAAVEKESAFAPAASTTRSSRLREDLTQGQVIAWFAACSRCSFFLAGYRLIEEPGSLEEAVQKSKAGWLTLNWSAPMRELVLKSFGSRLDIDCYHYENCCPDCRRHFIYRGAREDKRDSFRIELKPRPRY